MGNVTSRPDEGAALYLRDQSRLSISSIVVTCPRKRTSINIVPNAFPATRVSASRPLGDNTPVDFIQDTETLSPSGTPSFLLRLSNDDELIFSFTFVVRQTPPALQGGPAAAAAGANDTRIAGLTYVYASTARDVENLVTREFHADPNLHKNANVELVGDINTGGSPSVSFEWSWKWKPPKNTEDKGGGWRNACSFVEYDQHAHRLHTLASFSFWVANTSPGLSHPNSPTPPFLLAAPPKPRVPSQQSVDSRLSGLEPEEPGSPLVAAHDMNNGDFAAAAAAAASAAAAATATPATLLPPPLPAVVVEPVRVDVSFPRPGEDVTASDDGPVFRATIKALEQKTGNMRTQMKRVMKKAEQAQHAQMEANDAFVAFIDALREASSTNANAVQPALEHYFDKIARDILAYERQNTTNLQKLVIDPIARLYTMDIKQAEAKKRDFEEESKDYYAYVGRYLGQRHDSVKTKKLVDSDSKYQSKRRTFELKRFDYSSFMQDLSGGRKEQEVLSHLTRYADAQARSFLATSRRVEALLPQLEALSSEVQVADKEYQYQRREREEKRRILEKSTNGETTEPASAAAAAAATAAAAGAPAVAAATMMQPPPASNGNHGSSSDTELGRADSTGSQLRMVVSSSTGNNSNGASGATDLSRSPAAGFSLGGGQAASVVGSPPQNSRFKGIRDLEERDPSQMASLEKTEAQRKEGLLWALSRPGGHVDPRTALNKQGWHKFWIVLDQGTLSEYSNWKQRLDLHMDPIDLRMASVREARNAERRFCFEVITPHFKRVYQATSEEDMNSWILAINNALQSAVEGRGMRDVPAPSTANSESSSGSSFRRDIGSILTGKSPSVGHNSHHYHYAGAALSSSSSIPSRRITVGARPTTSQRPSRNGYDENPDRLLQMLRENDQGNCWCADCGSGTKVEWVSINLAIILCIECSGIHRSLGTHISKVRSLTLDITSFTPDIVELLLLVGNRVSNMVWEARLDPALKPSPQATREQRLRFITAKYVDRAYVEPISTTLSHYSTPDDTLLAAIKKNEIQQVIYALALRANPNVADKSRDTHSVFLALAAADPASPYPHPHPPLMTPTPPSRGGGGSDSAAGTGTGPGGDRRTIPFPAAELLVQNGAEIPAALPAFPLSRSAQLYVDLKRGRSTTAAIGPGPGAGSGADGVGSLPASLAASSSSSSGGDRLAREKEARLQKRVSAGGRLAKSPIPER